MSARIDFSANAGIYDRRHGASLPDDGLQRLWDAAGMHQGTRVLDVGAGTGRVAIPFAARGCRVAAIEPSSAMLAQLRAKDAEGRVRVIVAEGARLPCVTARFDVAVVARLLYLTVDWRAILSEASRALAVDGVLLHEWGNGEADEAWVRTREEARRLFEQAGVATPFHAGVRTEAAVDEQLVALSMVHAATVDLGPGPVITLRAFLGRLVDGELSYVWNVPEAVRADCLPRLRRWAEETFDLDVPTPMPRQIRWTVYRKAAR